MLRGIFYLIFLFPALFANSQIVLENSSFEGGNDVCVAGYAPLSWIKCEPGATYCVIDTYWYAQPDSAVDGKYIALLRVHHYNGSKFYASFSQLSPCLFKIGYTYSFDVFLASYIPVTNPTTFPYYSKVKLEVWLGSDSCQRNQQVYLSPLLDSFWVKYTIQFKPNADYGYFFFRGEVPSETPKLGEIDIDALSPIYVVNAHELEAIEQDTLFYEKKQQCISLSATASASMDSVWWEQVGVGIISQQLNAGVVCVDSNTTFIVHGIGTDSTCAGYLPSSDTVRVRFYDPTSSQPEVVQKTMLNVYPNPAKDYFTIEAEQSGKFQLYNSLGQLVLTKAINQGSNITLEVSVLSSGVYYYNFLSDGNVDTRGKLLKE